MTDLHELKGNEEQCRYLREAVDHYRMVLMRFGGLNVHVDNFIRERDDSMSAWQVKLQEILDND